MNPIALRWVRANTVNPHEPQKPEGKCLGSRHEPLTFGAVKSRARRPGWFGYDLNTLCVEERSEETSMFDANSLGKPWKCETIKRVKLTWTCLDFHILAQSCPRPLSKQLTCTIYIYTHTNTHLEAQHFMSRVSSGSHWWISWAGQLPNPLKHGASFLRFVMWVDVPPSGKSTLVHGILPATANGWSMKILSAMFHCLRVFHIDEL